MDMELIITAQATGSGKPLQVSISGDRLELLGFAPGRKVAISEEYGKLTISLLMVEEPHLPTAEQEQTAEPAVQLEAVEVIEPHTEIPDIAEVKPPQSLFQHLAALRKQISSEVNLPPYIIFHDSTLHDMCKLLPTDSEGMKDVLGVGKSKLEKYGDRFADAIREYTAVHGVEGAA